MNLGVGYALGGAMKDVWPETVEALSGRPLMARIANTTNTRITPSFTALRPQITEVSQQTPTQNLGYILAASRRAALERMTCLTP